MFMSTGKRKLSFAAASVTLTAKCAHRWIGRNIPSTKTAVGFGTDTLAPKGMGGWAFAAVQSWLTGQYGRKSTATFRPVMSWIIFAVNAPASIQAICASSLPRKTRTLEKSCAQFWHGAVFLILRQSTAGRSDEAYRQPSLFIPQPHKPEQKALDL